MMVLRYESNTCQIVVTLDPALIGSVLGATHRTVLRISIVSAVKISRTTSPKLFWCEPMYVAHIALAMMYISTTSQKPFGLVFVV